MTHPQFDGTTVAILTVPSNAALSTIHARMPLMLVASDYKKWLRDKSPESLIEK